MVSVTGDILFSLRIVRRPLHEVHYICLEQ